MTTLEQTAGQRIAAEFFKTNPPGKVAEKLSAAIDYAIKNEREACAKIVERGPARIKIGGVYDLIAQPERRSEMSPGDKANVLPDKFIFYGLQPADALGLQEVLAFISEYPLGGVMVRRGRAYFVRRNKKSVTIYCYDDTSAKTHPLSDHAWNVLAQLSCAPVPRSEVNPGVVDLLAREALIELVDLPSPFKTRKGLVQHLQITDAGRDRMAER